MAVVEVGGGDAERGAAAFLAEDGGGVDPVVEVAVVKRDGDGALRHGAMPLEDVDRLVDGQRGPVVLAEPYEMGLEFGGADAADRRDVAVAEDRKASFHAGEV